MQGAGLPPTSPALPDFPLFIQGSDEQQAQQHQWCHGSNRPFANASLDLGNVSGLGNTGSAKREGSCRCRGLPWLAARPNDGFAQPFMPRIAIIRCVPKH